MAKQDVSYGFELIMDLHECDVSKFNRKSLENYFTELCNAINMKKCECYFWDDVGVPVEDRQTSPHTKGTSAVQFILTSSIVVHTLDLLEAAYINIFSCKSFDKNKAEKFTQIWFGAEQLKSHFLERV